MRAFAQRRGRVLSRRNCSTATTGVMRTPSIAVLIIDHGAPPEDELDQGHPSVIVTVPGRGYKLATQVQNVEAADRSLQRRTKR